MCWPGQCTVVRYGACICDTRGSNNCLFTYKHNEKVWCFPSLSELMRIFPCTITSILVATRIVFLKYIVLKSKYWHYLRGCLANLCIWTLICFLKWLFSVPQWPKLLSKKKSIIMKFYICFVCKLRTQQQNNSFLTLRTTQVHVWT